MSGSDPLPVRAYRALTALLPGELGDRYADDATRVFADLYYDTVRDRGPLAGLTLWIRSAVALIACAVRERRATPKATRTGGGEGPMTTLWYEIRLAVRALAKRRAFSLTVILILAAGIGATTTIYSVVDTVVLRPLPYPDADRLMYFTNGSHSYPSLRAWLGMSSFESVSAVRNDEVDLTRNGEPERLPALAVSPDYFGMFGGRPALGRLFDAGDYPGDRSVVVLGYGLWIRRWGGDPDVVGRTLELDGAPSEVIGVLDPAFQIPGRDGGEAVDLWFALDDGGDQADSHGLHVLDVVGRLRPGTSREVAQEEVDAQRRAVADEFPRFYQRRDGIVTTTPLAPLKRATVDNVRSLLFTLLGAVGLLLFIACANVANLFLARGTARGREIALRGALGASRARIGAGVLIESTILSLVGGLLGVLFSLGGVALFLRFKPDGIPRIDTLAVDSRVLAFSAAVAVLTGIVFGALPAAQAIRTAPAETLKEGAASVSAGRSSRRLRSGLVVAEIALAAVLVTGAGLLIRSLVAQVRVDPGFDSDRLMAMTLSLDAGYDRKRRLQFRDEILSRIAALPGTRSVAAGWQTPFRRTGQGRCCWRTDIVGDPALRDEANLFGGIIHPVTSGYFETLGAEIAFGRELLSTGEDRPVAILNRPAARHLFGREDVVGRTITLRGVEDGTLEIVGVVDGVDEFGATEGVEEAVYVPYAHFGAESYTGLDVVVRSDAAPAALEIALREAVWALDADLPVIDITTMEDRMARSVAMPRFLSGLVGGFATLALLLACGGVYGSMLYSVSQRRREMGIRLALGAAGGDVVRLVLGQGIRLAAVGIVLGSLGAAAASGLMEQLLWGVEPTDPVTIASVVLLLGSVAVGASFIPAWQAARTDPVETLKAE